MQLLPFKEAKGNPQNRANLATGILNALSSQVALLDEHGVIIAVNEAWKHFAKENDSKDPTFYVGANYLTVCKDAIRRGDETAETALNGIRAVLHGEQNLFSLEYPCHAPDKERWFILRVTRLSQEASIGVVVAHEDITARKRAEIALQTSESRFRNLTKNLPDAIYTLDLVSRKVGYFNHDAFLGYSRSELMAPGSILDQLHPEDAPVVMGHWQQVITGEAPGSLEYRLRNKAGMWEWVESRETILSREADETPKEIMVILTVITDRKQAELELQDAKEIIEAANRELQQVLRREQFMARTDELTQVNNRRHFFDLATHEFAVAERYHYPLSIILFDIDHFKQVNDTYGHQVGDEVLQHVAQIARENLREPDILARYGGDEFIILLPGSNAQQAKIVAERIRKRVPMHGIDNSRGEVNITISMGIANVFLKEDDLDSLIQRADQALYNAKEAGRNNVKLFTAPVHQPKSGGLAADS